MWRKCWRVRETPVRTQRRSWRGGRPDRGPAGSAHCCSPAAKGEGRRRHRGRRTTREVARHGRRQTRTVGTAALTEDTGRCRSEAAGPTRGRGHFPPRPQVSPQRPRTRHPRRSPHHASADRRSAPPFTWSLQGPRTAERIGAFGVELDACHPRSAPATETQGQGAEGQAQGPRETDCAGGGGARLG